jgi:L,D-peptidoglycan transpeptidase YkuD (ErfK/YbiS/YcfS/YnhG family)
MAMLVVACMLAGCPEKSVVPSSPIDPDKTQLVTVVTDDWDRFKATLRRYERSPGHAWKALGPPTDVVLGREGYGWGRGLHGHWAPAGRPGPTKREGDGKSPAGVFEIGTAYGYDPARKGVALPYVQATPELRCVDDPASRHYNRIVSTANTAVDWKSAEYMRREDALYEIAIVVEHNTRRTEPGAGSCIFIHVWRGPQSGMTGCTAMPLSILETIADWLKPDAAVLVALPRSEYGALQGRWQLPH